jgi:hypothetical protein
LPATGKAGIDKKDYMNKVVLNGSQFSLRRDTDGAGDSGPMFNSINPKTEEMTHGVVQVGDCLQCGSVSARSYSYQDWWCTTPVTEILEVNEDNTEVKVKTNNSYYTIRAF